MERSVVKAVLGARANAEPQSICDRCHSPLDRSATVCPDCGAYVSGVEKGDSMSSKFDADLAKANLLRMRAEFRKAEEVCIGILKTYPNSAATPTLLGDIYSDQGLLEQAAQWYELSLDLDPSSLADKQKLDDVREQMQERDHISSVEQLGLPERRSNQTIWNVAMAAGILVIALGLGYGIRSGRMANANANSVVSTPIRATEDNVSQRSHRRGNHHLAETGSNGTDDRRWWDNAFIHR